MAPYHWSGLSVWRSNMCWVPCVPKVDWQTQARCPPVKGGRQLIVPEREKRVGVGGDVGGHSSWLCFSPSPLTPLFLCLSCFHCAFVCCRVLHCHSDFYFCFNHLPLLLFKKFWCWPICALICWQFCLLWLLDFSFFLLHFGDFWKYCKCF